MGPGPLRIRRPGVLSWFLRFSDNGLPPGFVHTPIGGRVAESAESGGRTSGREGVRGTRDNTRRSTSHPKTDGRGGVRLGGSSGVTEPLRNVSGVFPFDATPPTRTGCGPLPKGTVTTVVVRDRRRQSGTYFRGPTSVVLLEPPPAGSRDVATAPRLSRTGTQALGRDGD